MENPLRYLFGGVPIVLELAASANEARAAIAEGVCDPISGFMGGQGVSRSSYLLVGYVDTDRVRLRTPSHVRGPLWPLSPLLRGRLVAREPGSSVLEANLYIRKLPLLLEALVVALFIVQPHAPFRWFAAGVLLGFVLEFLFVLPMTKRELLRRVHVAAGQVIHQASPSL